MYRTTTGKASAPIASRMPFTTSGALSGRKRAEETSDALTPDGEHFGPWDSGRLPREHVDSFQRATYAVFSYVTPIAWVADGVWVIPSTRYSVTTSKHQSAARFGAVLSGLAVEVAA